MPERNNFIVDIIKKHLATLSKDEAKAFKEALTRYFSKNVSDFVLKGEPGPKLEHQKKHWLRQLYFGFGIPYHDYMDKEEVITPYSPNLNPLEVFAHLEHSDKIPGAEDQFIHKYVSSLSKYIQSAQNRIWVYDYLGIGEGKAKLPGSSIAHYSKAHKKIFDLIEAQIGDPDGNKPGINYLRILVLPLTKEDENTFRHANVAEERTRDMVLKCSLETFSHICRCLQKHPKQAKFYVAWRPTRMYHYGIMDKNYVVSEYYRYTSGGEFIPNLLFVENASHGHGEKQKELLKIYEKELLKLRGSTDRANEVNKDLMASATNRALSLVDSRLKTLKTDDEKRRFWEARKTLMAEKISVWNAIFPDDAIIVDI